MHKERIVNDIKSLQKKISREEKALQDLFKKAEQKGIKLYKYAS